MSIRSHHRPRQALLPAWPSPPDWSDLMARFEAMPPWTSLEGHMIASRNPDGDDAGNRITDTGKARRNQEDHPRR